MTTREEQWMEERAVGPGAWSGACASGACVNSHVVDGHEVTEDAVAGRGFGGRQVLPLSETVYSLRIPPEGHQAACPRCGHCWRLSGPTAYADGDPICDLCLLTSEQQLGMVLALVSVTRMYAGAAWTSPEDHHAGLVELGAFARIYDRFAARFGAPRRFDLGDLRLR